MWPPPPPPAVTEVRADGGHPTSAFQHGACLGIDVEVVQRPRRRGFEPLRRWSSRYRRYPGRS
ncbi:hypothetical protein SAMN05444921_11850 [Streptomyces wuyuanensis]|uniref:Transposase n=1 Tax=Streptomyces wuyuanensis TaxID=1196353 RepID=A0A1G9YCR6_9ACTN|nr:hypothetical protein SAMN05444921_11850 [Streptomyces wuyuanensis]